MLPDTEPRGLGGGRIQRLEQADGRRSGLVDRERIKTPSPAPVSAIHRIARTLHLRQRGQQFGRDCAGGIGAEQRPVLPPRLGRLLVQPVADEEEQLGRLADHVIDEVRQPKEWEQDRDGDGDPDRRAAVARDPVALVE